MADSPPSSSPPPAGEPSSLFAHAPACLLGLVLAFPARSFFLSQFVLQFIGTLVHELGHVLAGLAFGRIAVPALYLDGGGKAAIVFDPGPGAPILIAVLGAGAALRFLEGRNRLIALLALVPYVALGLTPGRDLVFAAGGHLGEIVWIGIALHLCLANGGISGTERVLYALSGWFLWIDRMKLFWTLRLNPNERIAYFDRGSAMGTVSDLLDLSVSGLGSFETVAMGFTVLGILVVVGVAWEAWNEH